MKPNCIFAPGSTWGDEYYTLEQTADQICRNIDNTKHLKAWPPFNDTNSVWGEVLRRYGIGSVATEGDFFETDVPKGCNCIISNPPFSIKKQILDRTVELGLPFVYILPFLWLNDSVPLEYGNQFIFFRRRVFFDSPRGTYTKPRSNCFAMSNGLFRRDVTLIRWEDYEKR